MTDPKRLTNDWGDVSKDERRILGADVRLHAPLGAKSEIWAAITAAVAAGAAVSISSSASASVATTGTSATAAGAVTPLTLGAVTKLVLVGVGIGTSLATVGHFWSSYESDPPQRIAERAVQPAASNTPAKPPPYESASRSSVSEAAPIRAQNNPTDCREQNQAEPTEPVEDSLQEPLPPVDKRADERPGANPHVAESMPTMSPGARDETLMVASARSMLRAGNAAYALEWIERAASRFPSGTLIQEREALRIEALVALGRTGEANALARQFAAAYPKSPHLRRLTNVLSTR